MRHPKQAGELISDLNQIVINLVSTGGAAAITMAVKKFLKRAPHAKVDVKEETQEARKALGESTATHPSGPGQPSS
jgi:hypothetical protein